MRVLVCGGRNYDNRELVWRALDQYQENYGPLTVIQGGAPGADQWAREWAHRQTPAQEVTLVSVPADWEKWGTTAGPKRNQMMPAIDAALIINHGEVGGIRLAHDTVGRNRAAIGHSVADLDLGVVGAGSVLSAARTHPLASGDLLPTGPSRIFVSSS